MLVWVNPKIYLRDNIMPRKPPLEKRPAHRPIKEIDWDVVDAYLEAQVSGAKIAAKLKVDPTTLYRRCEDEKGVTFTQYSQSRSDSGKADLLKKQYDVAMSGNTSLLLHLGEHVLDQTKKAQVEHSGNVTINRAVYVPEPSLSSIADDKPADADSTALPDTAVELP